MNDHCLTCKKLELVIDRLDKTDKKKNWLTITGIGLICTLIINLSVMTGIWRELDRLSRTVDTNTKIIYETKGVVEYLKNQNK